MKVYSGLQRGHFHKNFCEDFFINLPISESLYVGAVSDGCSAGRDAHLSSALLCKLLRKVVKKLSIDLTILPKDLALLLLKNLMAELKNVQELIDLQIDELLATLLLLVYSNVHKQAFVVVLGDGAVAIDNEVYEINQDNRPDYPAYHLADSEEVLAIYLMKKTFTAVEPLQIAIATDGIFSFKNHKAVSKTFETMPLDYLLKDNFLLENNYMITRKLNILNTQYGLQPSDDVSIIRIVV